MTLSSANPLRFRMSISEKIKTIDNKIEQNKAQYNLDRHTAKISALSSGNASKYEFLTGKDVLPEEDLLEKVATMKRFEYSPVGKELKSETDIAKNQYQKLDNTFGFDKMFKKEKPTLEKYTKSNLLYGTNHSFCRYYYDKKKINLSFKSMRSFLSEFFDDLDKLNNLNPLKEVTKKRKIKVYDTASELYNDFLGIYYHKY